ncbi:MAG: hypothetical protein Q7J35_18620 [Candidatus Methanoperedens sp.]|nr:hypothetical protein [Candidatus Methanoperedens sp.]
MEKYNGLGEYLVGYLDILGFEYLLRKHGPEIIHKSLKRILSDFRITLKSGDASGDYFFVGRDGSKASSVWVDENIKNIVTEGFFNFSDTIFLYVKLSDNSEENVTWFWAMCSLINEFIAISIQEPKSKDVIRLLFRGAISKGKGCVDKKLQIHMGDPFIKAYRLAECQEWMGGVIDKRSIDEDWIRKNIGFDKEIIEYALPLKIYNLNSINYVLNWTNSYPYDYSKLKSSIESYDWGSQEIKKNRTLEFITYAVPKRDSSRIVGHINRKIQP